MLIYLILGTAGIIAVYFAWSSVSSPKVTYISVHSMTRGTGAKEQGQQIDQRAIPPSDLDTEIAVSLIMCNINVSVITFTLLCSH
jgi:hypothetical protein